MLKSTPPGPCMPLGSTPRTWLYGGFLRLIRNQRFVSKYMQLAETSDLFNTYLRSRFLHDLGETYMISLPLGRLKI